MKKFIVGWFGIWGLTVIQAQPACVPAGADLSYINAVLDHQGMYRDMSGQAIDPYAYLAQKGCQMARFRVFHTPQNRSSYCGTPIFYNDLNDAILGMQRAKAQGMQLLASLHYGDYFNDPGRQKMPQAWMQASPSELCDSIYQYTRSCLERFAAAQVIPQWLAIGNETTWGFVQATESTTGWNWSQDRLKFGAALQAVADFNQGYGQQVKTMAHFTDSTALWMWQQLQSQQLTQFDGIGVSFYPGISSWTGWQEWDSQLNQLKNNAQKPIYIMETGASWTVTADDAYANFLNGYGNFGYANNPSGQLAFWRDLHQHAAQLGLSGILYWEPAWISSSFCDAWGQGSSYENNALFDYNGLPLPLLLQFQPCALNTAIPQRLRCAVWPNPTSSELFFEGPFQIEHIMVYNSLGQSMPITFSAAQIMDVSGYANGLYWVVLEGPCLREVRTIIKQ